MEQEKRDSVKSLGKALQLIDIINQARTPMTLMSLSQVSGFPKSTVYALLNTLRSYDCIRQGSDGRYYLGTRLFEWGCGVSASWELNNVARPYLEKLAAHTDATARQLSEAIGYRGYRTPLPGKGQKQGQHEPELPRCCRRPFCCPGRHRPPVSPPTICGSGWAISAWTWMNM